MISGYSGPHLGDLRIFTIQKKVERQQARSAPACARRAHGCSVQRRCVGLDGRPDRARWCRSGRSCCQGRWSRRDRLGQHRAWRCHPGADRCRVVRMARAEERRLPQLPRQGQQPRRRAHPRRPGTAARPRGARDDGARRLPRSPDRAFLWE